MKAEPTSLPVAAYICSCHDYQPGAEKIVPLVGKSRRAHDCKVGCRKHSRLTANQSDSKETLVTSKASVIWCSTHSEVSINLMHASFGFPEPSEDSEAPGPPWNQNPSESSKEAHKVFEARRQVTVKEIDRMLKDRIIEESASPWSSLTVVTSKQQKLPLWWLLEAQTGSRIWQLNPFLCGQPAGVPAWGHCNLLNIYKDVPNFSSLAFPHFSDLTQEGPAGACTVDQQDQFPHPSELRLQPPLHRPHKNLERGLGAVLKETFKGEEQLV